MLEGKVHITLYMQDTATTSAVHAVHAAAAADADDVRCPV